MPGPARRTFDTLKPHLLQLSEHKISPQPRKTQSRHDWVMSQLATAVEESDE